jgi:hypothetical protein
MEPAMAFEEYHGQEMRPGEPAHDVPPIPPEWGGRPREYFHGNPIASLDVHFLQCLSEAGKPEPNRAYPHVRLIGNYNIGCIDSQTLDYYDITPEQADEYAWQAFGVCPHVIAYFDEREQLVAGE